MRVPEIEYHEGKYMAKPNVYGLNGANLYVDGKSVSIAAYSGMSSVCDEIKEWVKNVQSGKDLAEKWFTLLD